MLHAQQGNQTRNNNLLLGDLMSQPATGASMLCGSCREPAPAMAEPLPLPLCAGCLAALSSGDAEAARAVLQSMDAPMLLMQPDPRLVITANDKALALFGKTLEQTQAHRGGEVFSCVHSFTEAGCGKDAHCEDCKIREAIVAGFLGAAAAQSTLEIRRGGRDQPHALGIKAAQAGGRALVRIERFEPQNGGHDE
jgi:hypothetical protein